MRISRPCYDKPHRCPGWAGGGWKSARRDRCEGGYVTTKTPNLPEPEKYGFLEYHCTCGKRILHTPGSHPLAGWRDLDGGAFCDRDPEAPWKGQGHRPPLEYQHPGADKWRFGHCAGSKAGPHADRTPGQGCGVVTIPWALRVLDPRWWNIYRYRVENWMRFEKGWLRK